MLSEISQRKIPYDLTYMWNLKTKQTKQNENRPIDRTNRWRRMGQVSRKRVPWARIQTAGRGNRCGIRSRH